MCWSARWATEGTMVWAYPSQGQHTSGLCSNTPTAMCGCDVSGQPTHVGRQAGAHVLAHTHTHTSLPQDQALHADPHHQPVQSPLPLPPPKKTTPPKTSTPRTGLCVLAPTTTYKLHTSPLQPRPCPPTPPKKNNHPHPAPTSASSTSFLALNSAWRAAASLGPLPPPAAPPRPAPRPAAAEGRPVAWRAAGAGAGESSSDSSSAVAKARLSVCSTQQHTGTKFESGDYPRQERVSKLILKHLMLLHNGRIC
jgi:hypothetical protein